MISGKRGILVALVLLGSAQAVASPRLMGKTTASQLAAAGEGALVTVLIDGRRFSSIKRYLRLLKRALPPREARHLAGVLQAKDLWSLIGAMLLGPHRSAPVRWPTAKWDRSRPLVFALFDQDASERALRARLALPPPIAEQTATRHRLLIPLRDDGASVFSAIIAGGKALGMKVEERRPKTLWMQLRRMVLAAVKEGDHVRIEWAEPHQIEPQTSTILQHVARAPSSGLAPKTPARATIEGAKGYFALAYVRSWLVRRLAWQRSLRLLEYSARYGDPALREAMHARGLARALAGLLLLDARGVEVDDLAFMINARPQLTVQAVASLTTQGQKVFDAGRAAAHRPFIVRGKQALRATLTAGLAAMLKTSALPPALEGLKARAMKRRFRRVGELALLGVLAQRPFGFGRAMHGLLPAPLQAISPGAVAVALELDARRRLFGLQFGLAASLEEDLPLAQLSSSLPFIRLLGALRVRARPGGKKAITLGTLPEPDRVFRDGRGKAALAWAEANLRSLASQIPLPRARAVVVSLRKARFELRRPHETALAATFTLGPRARFPKLRVLKVAPWASPGLARARSAGGRCLFEMTKSTQSMLEGLAFLDPAARGSQLRRWRLGLSKQLGCALKDPKTRAEAIRLQRALMMEQAEGLFWRRAKMLHLLGRACAKGIQRACARSKEVKLLPHVILVRSKGGQSLAMGLSRPIPPGLISLKGALPKTSARRIGVDARASYARLVQWMKKASAKQLRLVFDAPQGPREVAVRGRKNLSVWEAKNTARAKLGRDTLEVSFGSKTRKVGGLLWSANESDLEHLQGTARLLLRQGAKSIALEAGGALLWRDVLPVVVALDAGGLKVTLR